MTSTQKIIEYWHPLNDEATNRAVVEYLGLVMEVLEMDWDDLDETEQGLILDGWDDMVTPQVTAKRFGDAEPPE